MRYVEHQNKPWHKCLSFGRLFGSNGKSFVEQARHEGRVEPLRRSSSFLGSSLFREYISRDSSASGRGSDGTHSGSSSRRGSFSKRACRTCEKSSSTNYNPMISCLGCERPYHDSCRKPPLIDGVDPHVSPLFRMCLRY